MSVRCFDHSLTPADDAIAWQDQRSFLYGDGHFTTIKVQEGQARHLVAHVTRLMMANKRLKIQSFDPDAIIELLASMAKMLCSGYMRVHISRGQGGRGYGGASHLTPYVFVSTGEWSEQAQPKTFELEVVNWRLGHLPALAGLKHNNRLEQVMIAQELEEKRMADGLVLDIEDNLIETSKANLFWFDGQNWMTPDLSRCGIEGIIRAHILRQNPKIVVTNSKYSRVLDTCQSMLLCNSLLGCKAVTKLAGKSLNTQAIDTLNLTGT